MKCSTGRSKRQGKGTAHGSPSPGRMRFPRPTAKARGGLRSAGSSPGCKEAGIHFVVRPNTAGHPTSVEFLCPALDISCYCHHERWDGIGYPRDLRGEEISLAARISAVVDAGDAMTGGRPYWRGLLQGDVLKELKHGAGHSPIPLWSAHQRGKHVNLATAHQQRCVLQTNVRST